MKQTREEGEWLTIGLKKQEKIIFDNYAAEYGKFGETSGRLLVRMVEELVKCKCKK